MPQNQEGWRAVALRYLERFEAPAARVERVLQMRARRHNALSPEVEADIRAVIDDLCRLKLIDDSRFAEIRSGGLHRRGMGQRAIRQDLAVRGVDEEIVTRTVDDSLFARREAVIIAARKKRLGPFRSGRSLERWESEKEKQFQREMGTLARLGHGLEDAKHV
ncbi:MAG: RecX family transcriptional regulator, partial [Sphingomonadales bacterium]